jgi:hypothetical protein
VPRRTFVLHIEDGNAGRRGPAAAMQQPAIPSHRTPSQFRSRADQQLPEEFPLARQSQRLRCFACAALLHIEPKMRSPHLKKYFEHDISQPG